MYCNFAKTTPPESVDLVIYAKGLTILRTKIRRNMSTVFPLPSLRAGFAGAGLALMLFTQAANGSFSGFVLTPSTYPTTGPSGAVAESSEPPSQTSNWTSGFVARKPILIVRNEIDVDRYFSFGTPGVTRLIENRGVALVRTLFPNAEVGIGDSLRLTFSLNASGLNGDERRIGFWLESAPVGSTWGPIGPYDSGGSVFINDATPIIWLDDSTETTSGGFADVPVEILLARNAAGYDMTVTLGGVVESISRQSSLTSVDHVGLALNGVPLGATYWIDDLSVAVIPEPSTYALLFGLGALAVALYRRCRV